MSYGPFTCTEFILKIGESWGIFVILENCQYISFDGLVAFF